MAACTISEIALTKDVVRYLVAGMLALADRNFFGYEMWNLARARGADLLWRIKKNARLKREKILPDGSYLSHIYPTESDRRHNTNGVQVRVIDYRLEGVADAEPIYRLVTTILDHELASAEELAALYHERWEIDIDQTWRLSRIKDWRVWVNAGKQGATEWQGCRASGFEFGDGGRVRGDEFVERPEHFDRAAA